MFVSSQLNTYVVHNSVNVSDHQVPKTLMLVDDFEVPVSLAFKTMDDRKTV